MVFWIYTIFILILSVRVLELYISRKNEQWLKVRGAIEDEGWKYRWIYLLHWLFFLSILAECLLLIQPDKLHTLFFFLFIVLTAGKLWCMVSLGRFWTLKKLMLPGVLLFRRGPYRLIKEPYNIISIIQLFIVPLLFGAYLTALIFPLIHLLIIQVKLPEKGRAYTKAPL
ncbi:isoprenylcysteine carboxylmethyltransferase family protein [Virgibacillus kimchii]